MEVGGWGVGGSGKKLVIIDVGEAGLEGRR